MTGLQAAAFFRAQETLGSVPLDVAITQNYLPREWRGIEAIGIAKEAPAPIGILSPAEMRTLLENAEPHVLPFLAIGAFAGIRHFEIQRLDWKDFDWQSKWITVGAEKTKTASRRLVPILPALEAWLAPYRKDSGPVCTYKNMSEEILLLTQKVGVKWPYNGLRHSYASYRLAATQNANALALEMGNSPSMIHQHYKELVKPEQAEQWFSMRPTAPAATWPRNKAGNSPPPSYELKAIGL